mmetsp:Transcript_18059/g.54338  ORF Transcript_18059/g.54338 Transcript_18059/m.54338 type:complete len:922 (+) Transcript_18059:693-3458(+)
MHRRPAAKRARRSIDSVPPKSNPRPVSDTKHFVAAMEMFEQQAQQQQQQQQAGNSLVASPHCSEHMDSSQLTSPSWAGAEHQTSFGAVIFPGGTSFAAQGANVHADAFLKQQVAQQAASLLRLAPQDRAPFMHRDLYAVGGSAGGEAAKPLTLPADTLVLRQPQTGSTRSLHADISCQPDKGDRQFVSRGGGGRTRFLPADEPALEKRDGKQIMYTCTATAVGVYRNGAATILSPKQAFPVQLQVQCTVRRAWLVRRQPYDVIDYLQHPSEDPASGDRRRSGNRLKVVAANIKVAGREAGGNEASTRSHSGGHSGSRDIAVEADAGDGESGGEGPGGADGGRGSGGDSALAAVTLKLAGSDAAAPPRWPGYGNPPHLLCNALVAGPSVGHHRTAPGAGTTPLSTPSLRRRSVPQWDKTGAQTGFTSAAAGPSDRSAPITAADAAAGTITVLLPQLDGQTVRQLRRQLSDSSARMEVWIHTVQGGPVCSRFRLEEAVLDTRVELPLPWSRLQLDDLIFATPPEVPPEEPLPLSPDLVPWGPPAEPPADRAHELPLPPRPLSLQRLPEHPLQLHSPSSHPAQQLMHQSQIGTTSAAPVPRQLRLIDPPPPPQGGPVTEPPQGGPTLEQLTGRVQALERALEQLRRRHEQHVLSLQHQLDAVHTALRQLHPTGLQIPDLPPQQQQQQQQAGNSLVASPHCSEHMDSSQLTSPSWAGAEHQTSFGAVIFPGGTSFAAQGANVHADAFLKQQVAQQAASLLRLAPQDRAPFMHRDLYAVGGSAGGEAAKPLTLPADTLVLRQPQTGSTRSLHADISCQPDKGDRQFVSRGGGGRTRFLPADEPALEKRDGKQIMYTCTATAVGVYRNGAATILSPKQAFPVQLQVQCTVRRAWLVRRQPYDVIDYLQHPSEDPASVQVIGDEVETD